MVEMVGADQILWASDYPHEREHHEYLTDIPEFLERTDLTEGTKRKIVYDNAVRLYRLDEPAAVAGRPAAAAQRATPDGG